MEAVFGSSLFGYIFEFSGEFMRRVKLI